MNKERVIFFCKRDLSAGDNLLLAEKILDNYHEKKSFDINDILELYSIKLFFDNNIYLNKWDKYEIANYKKTVKLIWSTISQFFVSLEYDKLIYEINTLEFDYRTIFWCIIESLNTYKNISKITFEKILINKNVYIIDILSNKRIVSWFDLEIKNYLLQYSNTTELLLTEYEEKHTRERSRLFFPKSLKQNDIEGIISKYLDNSNANTNYVDLIINSKLSNNFRVSDKIRLKAIKLSEKIKTLFFENKNGVIQNYRNEIGLIENQVSPLVKTRNNGHFKITYSLDYLDGQKDHISMFHNFSSLFKYTDSQRRISLIYKASEADSLEFLGLKSKHTYPKGRQFLEKDFISNMQIMIYSCYLKSIELNLESIIDSFVKNQLIKNLNLQNLKLNFPSLESSNLEKVRMIAPELEYLFKQYNSFVNDGLIEHELLQISSSPIRIKDIPSLSFKKYVYGTENPEFLKIRNLFFSKQSFLYYVEPFKNKYNNLYQLLINEKVNYNLFKDYQKGEIDKLIKEEYLEINSNNIILIKNILPIYLIGEIYYNEVINYNYYITDIQVVIDKLVENEVLCLGNTLLSKQESDYFNYYLNKSMFTNSLDLRNKYVHGTNGDSDEEHGYAYNKLLKLLILVLIKIENELTTNMY
ncbi:hypothetical protein [Polaribacter vadi]|uniref:hypothetical protein n=1 Tax=Polaribacter vadi TaxID=1774273 RepID=UPI0030EF3D34|tara:strand:- start:4038 stop:5960 length:1923 start_codon:yes stop_codon:yes gene_type:complete